MLENFCIWIEYRFFVLEWRINGSSQIDAAGAEEVEQTVFIQPTDKADLFMELRYNIAIVLLVTSKHNGKWRSNFCEPYDVFSFIPEPASRNGLQLSNFFVWRSIQAATIQDDIRGAGDMEVFPQCVQHPPCWSNNGVCPIEASLDEKTILGEPLGRLQSAWTARGTPTQNIAVGGNDLRN